MLVVSNKRLVPVQINTMILQGEDGNYYYLHRDLYDQLVMLSGLYENGARIDLIVKNLTGEDTPLPENMQMFYDTVPMPIKMAAPFLLMIEGGEKLSSIDDMCGALTILTMSVNLRLALKVDKSLRAACTLSLHVVEEYRTHWDRFFQENPEFGSAVTLPAPLPTTNHIPTPEGTTIIQNKETGDEMEVTFTTPIESFDFDKLLGEVVEANMAPVDDTPIAGASPAADSKDSWGVLDNI